MQQHRVDSVLAHSKLASSYWCGSIPPQRWFTAAEVIRRRLCDLQCNKVLSARERGESAAAPCRPWFRVMSIVLHITWRKLLFRTTSPHRQPLQFRVYILCQEQQQQHKHATHQERDCRKMIKVSGALVLASAREQQSSLHLSPLHCQYLICILSTKVCCSCAVPFKIQSLLLAKTTPWMYFLWSWRDWTGTAVVLIFISPGADMYFSASKFAPPSGGAQRERDSESRLSVESYKSLPDV